VVEDRLLPQLLPTSNLKIVTPKTTNPTKGSRDLELLLRRLLELLRLRLCLRVDREEEVGEEGSGEVVVGEEREEEEEEGRGSLGEGILTFREGRQRCRRGVRMGPVGSSKGEEEEQQEEGRR